MSGATAFTKVDVVHHLAQRFGYRRYLEIATATTGQSYGKVDRSRFEDCRRLLYNTPADFSDGAAIDYVCPGLDIAAGLAAIAAQRRRFDIVFVDPWHFYEPSRRDVAAAFALVEPGGAVVVHDCRPPSADIAQPEHQPGDWCGVTYKAYLDHVLGRTDLRYLTVDTDYGCGVIRKAPLPLGQRLAVRFGRRRLRRAVAQWQSFGSDYAAAWRYFDANHVSLLKLVSVEAFVSGAHALL